MDIIHTDVEIIHTDVEMICTGVNIDKEIVYSALNIFVDPFRQYIFYVIHRTPLIY